MTILSWWDALKRQTVHFSTTEGYTPEDLIGKIVDVPY